VVKGVAGPIIFYFVRFDSPQDDGSGDGPYKVSEIDECYLERMQAEEDTG